MRIAIRCIVMLGALLQAAAWAQQPAFVQVAAATPQTAQTSVAVPFNSTQTSGNLNVIVVGWNDVSSTVSSVTDSLGNTYTLAVGPTKSTGITQSIYYAKNITGGSNTVTVTFNQAAAFADIRILEYSGVDKANPLDVAHGASGATASPDSGAATTTSNGDLLVGAGTTLTSFSGPGSGFSMRTITTPDGDIAEDRVVTGTGSFSASAPLGSAGDWVMQMAAFRAANASGVVTTVAPPSTFLASGGTQQFTATVTGSSNTAVTWSATGGTISTTGLFTAPNISSFTHITVTATSAADPTSSATATVTVHPPFPAYPLKQSANKRYLVDQNNVPFLIQGDSPQAMTVNVSERDAEYFIADRAAAGFNCLWVNLLCDTYTGGRSDGTTYDGIAPFTTPGDLSTPNEAFFKRVDDMVQIAANYGITIFLDPIETGGWLGTMQNNGTTKCFNYGVYVGNRYKNFPNIVWLHGNDFQSWRTTSDDALAQAVAHGIASIDATHMHTVELDYQVSGSLDDPTWAPPVNLDAAYTYFPTYAEVLKEYNRTNFQPVFMVEANYEGEHNAADEGTPQILRRQEYWTELSGATGQFFGNHWTWQFAGGWQSELDTACSIQIGYASALLLGRPWYNLVPDQTHTLVTAGFGTFTSGGALGDSDYASVAATPDGKVALAYMPTLRTFTVNMVKFAGPVTAQWYDPSIGKYQAISGSPFSNSGSRQFTPSGNNSAGDGDWVLVLTAVPNGNQPPQITSPAAASPSPANVNQTVTFAVGASDPNGDTLTYAWSFGDGANGSGATSTHAYATAGTYTATVTVSDGHGGTAISSVTLNVGIADTQPPSVPANVAATAISSTQISVSWSASTDNVGVTGYRIFRNNTQLTTSTGTSFSDSGLTPNTTYTYTVSAFDAAGNASAQSAPASATTPKTPVTAAFVQQNSTTPQSPQKQVSVPFTFAQSAGNCNILAIGWNDTTSSISAVTDSAGNTYQVAAATVRGTKLSQAIYYARNINAATAGANTVTVVFSANAAYVDLRVFEYAGLDTTSPFDVAGSRSGTGTSASSAAVTTHSASELIFGAGMTFGVFTNGGSGFTVRVTTSPDGDIGEDKFVTATGSYAATATNTNDPWVMQVATFKVASNAVFASTNVAPAAAAAAPIDLGAYTLGQRFKAKLTVPMGLTNSGALRYKLAKGSTLPDGLRISGGAIGGKPRTAGTFPFDVVVSSKGGGGTVTYSITIE